MACKESKGRQNLLRLGLFACAISLCHCASVAGLQALDNLKESSNPSHKQAQGTLLQHHGRLLIGQNQNQQGGTNGTRTDFLDVGADVQADMGEWARPTQQTGQMNRPMQDMATVQRLLQLEPKVECTVDSIMLQLHDAASTPLIFVDRGYRLPPLPLSKLPSSCGYDIQSTHSNLVLVAPYDGCFVAHEVRRPDLRQTAMFSRCAGGGYL
ncbi:uncharacterized protein LOC114479549 [Gouania willdenowi]|uniref:uncharacterized protein LOC114479549 n=1 Tax=Gouania willdenowi TaxID=441366 RepID=UPI00105451E2|nr:uncharacterized protein LOC114479549 [Gouania willdenowi]